LGESKLSVSSPRKRSTKDSATRTPEWALEHFQRFFDQTSEALDLLHASIHGIRNLTLLPETVELLLGGDRSVDPDEAQSRRQAAKHRATVAQREIESGFRTLHSQSLVAVWGQLEAAVRDFLAAWIRHAPTAMEADRVRGLRVRLGDYLGRSEDERAEYLVDLIDEDLGSSHRYGVTRFESLLDVFQLGGPVPDRIRRDIYELQQVRNVLVHRLGVADRRLVESCPWLKLAVGDSVAIEHPMVYRLTEATHEYVAYIVQRIHRIYGDSRADNIPAPSEESRASRPVSAPRRKSRQSRSQ